MASPEDRVNIAIAESERFKEYLGSLPSEAWDKPSACDRWQVRDVVAHLAATAEAYIQRTHESLQIDLSTYDNEKAPGPVSADSLADGNAQNAISRRECLGDQVFSDFVERSDELNKLISTLGPQDWGRPHYYASIGTEPLRLRPDLWISELAMHGWDIRSKLEADARLSEESLPVFMDMIPAQLERFIFRAKLRLPEPTRYRWELTGMGAGDSDIVVEGDKASVQAAGTGTADVTFRCETETFVLITFGRLAIESAITAGSLKVQGDNSLALEYQRWFPGM